MTPFHGAVPVPRTLRTPQRFGGAFGTPEHLNYLDPSVSFSEQTHQTAASMTKCPGRPTTNAGRGAVRDTGGGGGVEEKIMRMRRCFRGLVSGNVIFHSCLVTGDPCFLVISPGDPFGWVGKTSLPVGGCDVELGSIPHQSNYMWSEARN